MGQTGRVVILDHCCGLPECVLSLFEKASMLIE